MLKLSLSAGLIAAVSLLTACDQFSERNALIEEAHKAVAKKMKDPESAKFDDETTQVFEKIGLVCGGAVNAKNSFGAYAGSDTYYYARGTGAATMEDESYVWEPLSKRCIDAINEHTLAIYKSMGKAPPPEVTGSPEK